MSKVYIEEKTDNDAKDLVVQPGREGTTLNAYASGNGSLSFVIRDENRNPAAGQRPQVAECIAYIKDKLATGEGHWKGSDWVIVNQGPLDRENHEQFSAVRKVERVGANSLKMGEHVYDYNPAQVENHAIPKFTFELSGRVQEIDGAGNNGALGYFLKNEKTLSDPLRVVYDSTLDGPIVGKYTVADMRSDIKGKLLAEKATSLDDSELHRVFDAAVLSDYCVRQAQAARAAGITMADIKADVEREHTERVLVTTEKVCAAAKGYGIDVDADKVTEIVGAGAGPDKGVFCGRIVGVDGKLGLVYQSTGRDGAGVVLPISKLSRGVTEGAIETITFKDGYGTVADRTQDLGKVR